jgi:hypothetical protein
MISKYIDSLVSVNLGRPNMFDGVDFSVWCAIFHFIEECPIQIAVNGVYSQIREYCDAKLGYGGSGFRFEFGFQSMEDCAAFEEGVNTIWAKYFQDQIMVSAFNRRLLK